MRIELNNIFKKFRVSASRERGMLTHPYRDWGLLLVGCALLAAALVSVGAYLFFEIRSGDLYRSTSMISRTTEDLGADAFGEVLEFYADRKRTYETLLETQPTLLNPAE